MNSKDRDRQYSRIIVNLANNALKPSRTVLKDIGEVFGLSKSFTKRAAENVRTWPFGARSGIDINKDTRSILENLASGVGLYRNQAFRTRWIPLYNNLAGKQELVLTEKGSLISGTTLPDELSKSKAEDWTYDTLASIVCFCMVELLKTEENKGAFGKCEHCGKFYFAPKRRPLRRFCSDKCRMDWNNHLYIKSGKARERKRRRRAEGYEQ